MPPDQMDETQKETALDSSGDLDLFGIALEENPHARWAEIREAHPVLEAGGGVYFISDWALVDEVLRDPRHHAGTGVADSFGANDGLVTQVMNAWLMSLDGPEQTRARGLVRREFTPRQVERLRPEIGQAADALIRKLETTPLGEEIDLIEHLAFALPSEVIRSLFGWPEQAWATDVERIIRSIDDRPGASIEMIEGLARTFEAALKQGNAPTGLLTQLQVPDETLGRLSPIEIIANAVLLVSAAIDTTAGLIGNAIHCLMSRPEVVTALRRDPRLISAVVEETLRFEAPALSCSRRATESFRLGDVTIPDGSQLLLGLAAANRDPARYDDPNTFRLDRDFQGLLSFGGGRHFCLGAALARLEATIVLERFFIHSEFEFERSGPIVWQKKNPTVRALDSLLARVTPRTQEA